MTRAAQKQHTRQRVIDAATHLFATQGLASTKTVDIAKHAGLSHGGVFVHFKSRDALLSEVVSSIGREITDRLHATLQDQAELPMVLRTHLNCLELHETAYAAFLRESRLLPKEVLSAWIGVQSAISNYLQAPARVAIERGLIHDMPMHLLFNTWIGLVHHYLMNRELFDPDGSVLLRHGDQLIAHFISLIAVDRKYSSRKANF